MTSADTLSSPVHSFIAIQTAYGIKQTVYGITYIENESNLLVVGSTVNYTLTSVSYSLHVYIHEDLKVWYDDFLMYYI